MKGHWQGLLAKKGGPPTPTPTPSGAVASRRHLTFPLFGLWGGPPANRTEPNRYSWGTARKVAMNHEKLSFNLVDFSRFYDHKKFLQKSLRTKLFFGNLFICEKKVSFVLCIFYFSGYIFFSSSAAVSLRKLTSYGCHLPLPPAAFPWLIQFCFSCIAAKPMLQWQWQMAMANIFIALERSCSCTARHELIALANANLHFMLGTEDPLLCWLL